MKLMCINCWKEQKETKEDYSFANDIVNNTDKENSKSPRFKSYW